MVTGPDGKAGADAVRAVVEENRAEREPAPTPHLLMVAENVQETTRKLALATTSGGVQVSVSLQTAVRVLSDAEVDMCIPMITNLIAISDFVYE